MIAQGTAWWGVCPECQLSFGNHFVECSRSGVVRVNTAAANPIAPPAPILNAAVANPLPTTYHIINAAGCNT